LVKCVAILAAVCVSPAFAEAVVSCRGDCNGDGQVDIAELTIGVRISLGQDGPDRCRAFDADGDDQVFVFELLGGVRRSLDGCPYPHDDELRLNHFQVLASHNSYHVQADPPVFQAIADFSQALADSLEYTHVPLREQFETQGIRAIELDVFADPLGGLFASPLGLREQTGDPNSTIPEMETPGLKVLHVQDIDYQTTCRRFVDCLETVKAWSDEHPLHMPLMVQIEAKDDVIPNGLGGFEFVVPVPFGAAELDSIDAEIRSVFPPEQLITPDDVRGTHDTLAEAIRTDGWPTLAASRGKVLFTLDNEGRRRLYLQGHPSLRGRVLFTPASPDDDDAAFLKLNDPIADFAEIQQAVADGFVVRTRADGDTDEARTNTTTQRDKAIESGAQWVSTDYPVPDPDFTPYMVDIPDGVPARCNPISAPSSCAATDIENPGFLVP
jgi:hypothetical protein